MLLEQFYDSDFLSNLEIYMPYFQYRLAQVFAKRVVQCFECLLGEHLLVIVQPPSYTDVESRFGIIFWQMPFLEYFVVYARERGQLT